MKLVTLALCGLVMMTSLSKAEIGALDNNPFAIEGQSGKLSISQQQGSHFYICDVAYAVFETANYIANGGIDASNGSDKYTYAYQLFNSEQSNIDVKVFGVQIPEGISVNNITQDISGTGAGVIPQSGKLLNDIVVWRFSNNPIEPGKNSSVLLFTSDLAPGQSDAGLHSGNLDGLTGITIVGPAPTPEPATLLMLGLGSIISITCRKKK